MKHVPALAAAALLAGCASTDHAVFVTKTSLSILDADTTPANISVAYDRTEGFFGPSFGNGAAPPVAAIIQSDGKIFNPHIRQLYATGTAAAIVTDKTKDPGKDPKLEGDRRLMFFGTSTTTGLKVSFLPNAPVPTSFSFGFKRKEASYLPLQLNDDKKSYTYPAAFASIDTKATAGEGRTGTGLKVAQVFATGTAADHMAKELRDDFKVRAQDAIGAARLTTQQQRGVALDILRAYVSLDSTQFKAAFEDATRLGLVEASDDTARRPILYARGIATPNVDDPARLKLLRIHLETIDRVLAQK